MSQSQSQRIVKSVTVSDYNIPLWYWIDGRQELCRVSVFQTQNWCVCSKLLDRHSHHTMDSPWRFIYAKRNTAHWVRLFNLMVDFNKSWTKNAAVLIVIISRKNWPLWAVKPSVTHEFDTGAAWKNLALQAETQGMVTHGMQGFDYERQRGNFQYLKNLTLSRWLQ
jgi:hypothetical protein